MKLKRHPSSLCLWLHYTKHLPVAVRWYCCRLCLNRRDQLQQLPTTTLLCFIHRRWMNLWDLLHARTATLQHWCDRHKHKRLRCAASLDMRALWCWTVKRILLAEATHQWQPDSTTLHNKNVFYLLYYLYLFIIWTHYIVTFSCIPIISGFQPWVSLLYATLWFFAVFSFFNICEISNKYSLKSI